MKLRNKKTGEIVEVESLYLTQTQELYLNYTNEENKQKVYMTDKIASFNLDWEDYEEPKDYFYIRDGGNIDHNLYGKSIIKRHQEIGNYFETKEEAEKAVEKLKAWNRLRECGLIPLTWTNAKGGCILVKYGIGGPGVMDCLDFDLLFGGEE